MRHSLLLPYLARYYLELLRDDLRMYLGCSAPKCPQTMHTRVEEDQKQDTDHVLRFAGTRACHSMGSEAAHQGIQACSGV